ncbi:MAG: VOC family protein [Caldilineaceae bacterium]
MSTITSIAEIVLWTADQSKSLTFYRDLLGFPVISPPHLPNVFLKVAEGHAGIPQMIVLVPKSAEVKAKPSGFQLHHLAFEVPPEFFDPLQDRLVAAGFAPRSGKHPVLASRTMYVDDPDGYEVEFICRD